MPDYPVANLLITTVITVAVITIAAAVIRTTKRVKARQIRLVWIQSAILKEIIDCERDIANISSVAKTVIDSLSLYSGDKNAALRICQQRESEVTQRLEHAKRRILQLEHEAKSLSEEGALNSVIKTHGEKFETIWRLVKDLNSK